MSSMQASFDGYGSVATRPAKHCPLLCANQKQTDNQRVHELAGVHHRSIAVNGTSNPATAGSRTDIHLDDMSRARSLHSMRAILLQHSCAGVANAAGNTLHASSHGTGPRALHVSNLMGAAARACSSSTSRMLAQEHHASIRSQLWKSQVAAAQVAHPSYGHTGDYRFTQGVGAVPTPNVSRYMQSQHLQRVRHRSNMNLEGSGFCRSTSSATNSAFQIPSEYGGPFTMDHRSEDAAQVTHPSGYMDSKNIQRYASSRQGHRNKTLSRPLPMLLSRASDELVLNQHQVFIRAQIEVFRAAHEDVTTHLRGRNRPVQLGQVGIRCRHCAHLPAASRTPGSVYFPATILGIYQAAQNMSSNHLQCGKCNEMPDSLKLHFALLIPSKRTSSIGGRSYWADSAKTLGLVDSDSGIVFRSPSSGMQGGSNHAA